MVEVSEPDAPSDAIEHSQRGGKVSIGSQPPKLAPSPTAYRPCSPAIFTTSSVKTTPRVGARLRATMRLARAATRAQLHSLGGMPAHEVGKRLELARRF